MNLRHFFISASCVAAIAAGCTINAGEQAKRADGTTPVDGSSAQALISGQVDASVGANVQFHVNGHAQPIVLAPDASFVVRDVPLGNVTFDCDAGGVKGELTIQNVLAGDIIEVTIKLEADAIVIVIERRTSATEAPRVVSDQDGDALQITASHVCYWFKPGHYKRDVIVTGDDVHLFGAAHESCAIDDFTILDGKLELDGKNITVLDVDLTGSLVIKGAKSKVQDSCTKCFDEGCERACGDEDHGGHACGGHESGEDAGAPVDASVSHDAATSSDAGTPYRDSATVDATPADGGVATETGAADAPTGD